MKWCYDNGTKFQDVVIFKQTDGNQYECECVDCHQHFFLSKTQLRNRKTPFCQCAVDKLSHLQNDLRYQIFGDLTVIDIDFERTNEAKEKYGKKMVFWRCKCNKCGTESFHTVTNLKKIQSLNRSGCPYCRGIYLVGQKFGRLTVIEDLGTKGYGERFVRCRCDCGNIINIKQISLLTGKHEILWMSFYGYDCFKKQR